MNKTIIFAFLALPSFIGMSAQDSESYHPFLKDGKRWNYSRAEYYDSEMHNSLYSLRIDGDSVLNGTGYFKMFKELEDGTRESFGLWREKDRKVYWWTGHSEMLMYDFASEEGGMVLDNPEVLLAGTDTVLVSGSLWRRFKIRRSWSEYDLYWVEGVGGRYGLDEPLGHELNDGVSIRFLSCYEDGQCVFTAADFDSPAYHSADDKCATPTIAYDRGRLVFSCETPGVEYVYEIKCADTGRDRGSEVSLSQTYKISVYAARDGFNNSYMATATIGWRNGRPVMEGFSSVTLDDGDGNGDVNGDGKVDVADIADIISIMAGQEGSRLAE